MIVLTARGDELDRVLGLELGADDYVTKPFSAAELLARIRAVLRRTDELGPTEPTAASRPGTFGSTRRRTSPRRRASGWS